ncbi:1-acyl-sn-glycerol-3-phosphate acyltransferase [Croceiramulus getboli]|nr:1-acyl-sn-glycerol-3-phosphate acyltransferase [Flavobacteriaceae bacterium YJPT1-3]
MNAFEEIRPYHDDEVAMALEEHAKHPMFRALLHFTFPEDTPAEIQQRLEACHSIKDFQKNIIYYAVDRVIRDSMDGLYTHGFEDLDPSVPYFYISNHRDIILDTSLLNYTLSDHDLIMTASAIGDNLVHKPFLMALSRLNRNFLVRRGLSPREMLASSRTLSEYIKSTFEAGRSVWMAQREGRTKDGNDRTQQGVLKMLAMAKGDLSSLQYLKQLNMVTVSISYEFDPTDVLKVPEMVARQEDEEYVKSNNEDFNSILRGALGNKKKVCLTAESLPDEVFDSIDMQTISENDKLQLLCEAIDQHLHQNYKLWPSNYIAYDLLHDTQEFQDEYNEKDKRQFERRIARRVEADKATALQSFLLMYANPVINKKAL